MRSRGRGYCPICLYIGPPQNCACQHVIKRVADGKGSDPEVLKDARVVAKLAEEAAR
jgi:hypothetical protein